MADTMAVFKRLVKNGKELGRGNSFSFNENQQVLSVGLDEYERLSRAKHTISNVCEDDNVLRCIAEHYRKCRNIYEVSCVDLRKEIM